MIARTNYPILISAHYMNPLNFIGWTYFRWDFIIAEVLRNQKLAPAYSTTFQKFYSIYKQSIKLKNQVRIISFLTLTSDLMTLRLMFTLLYTQLYILGTIITLSIK